MSQHNMPPFGDEQIRLAFANLKDNAATQFPPPNVNDIIYMSPVRRRRKRIMGVIAGLSASGLVTVGGLALANNLGDPNTEPSAPPTVMNSAAEGSANSADSSGLGTSISLPLWDANGCAAGDFAVDRETWNLSDAGAWEISQALIADATGNGHDNLIIALDCNGSTIVAAMTNDDAAYHVGWIGANNSEGEILSIDTVANGIVSLRVAGVNGPETVTYIWDGSAFIAQ